MSMPSSCSHHRTRHSWRHRRSADASAELTASSPSRTTAVDLDLITSTAAGAQCFCESLARDGFATVSIRGSAPVFAECLKEMAAFFALPSSQKQRHAAAHGPGCNVGFMFSDKKDSMEIFEAKCLHNPQYPWPSPTLQRAVTRARDLLHRTARACLRALAAPLGLDAAALEGLLDAETLADGPGAQLQQLAAASMTTMRVWRYPAGVSGNEMHCDNSLLTLAPAGTRVGLAVRRKSDGATLMPEEALLGEGEIVVFAGDALGFLTAGRIPALVHWVMGTERERLSMPFFLRPRPDAMLHAHGPRDVQAICQRDLEGGGKTCAYGPCNKEGNAVCGACGLSTYCSVEHQLADWKAGHQITCGKRGKIAERWPWKADAYYLAGPGEKNGRGVISWSERVCEPVCPPASAAS